MNKNGDLEPMTQSGSTYKHPAGVRDAVVGLYRQGHELNEIVDGLTRRGGVWEKLNRSTVGRWLMAAREDDPDLVIRHHLVRRGRKPGIYNDWRIVGSMVTSPFYDVLTDTMYLGPGMDFMPLPEGREPAHIIRVDEQRDDRDQPRRRSMRRRSIREAVGPYVAELSSLGYSLRDIAKVWAGKATKNPALDKSDRVRWLRVQLNNLRKEPMSPSTIRRILQVHEVGDVAQSLKDYQMYGIRSVFLEDRD